MGLADVEDDGEIEPAGDFKLIEEDAALHELGGIVVVVIEAALAEGEDFGFVAEAVFEESFVAGFDIGGVMGVDAKGGEDGGVGAGEGEGFVVIGDVGSDGDDAHHAGGGGAGGGRRGGFR